MSASVRVPRPPPLPPPPMPKRIPSPTEVASDMVEGVERFIDNVDQSIRRGPLDFLKRMARDISVKLRRL